MPLPLLEIYGLENIESIEYNLHNNNMYNVSKSTH
jgi:hypothetical protein